MRSATWRTGSGKAPYPLARPDHPVTLPVKDSNPPIEDGLDPGTTEALYYDCERRPFWVSVTDASVKDPETGLTATIRTFRDITRQKEAESRRAASCGWCIRT